MEGEAESIAGDDRIPRYPCRDSPDAQKFSGKAFLEADTQRIELSNKVINICDANQKRRSIDVRPKF